MRKKRSEINFTKVAKADLDPPRQELSNGDLGIVVALSFSLQLIFCVFLLGSNPAVHIIVLSRKKPADEAQGLLAIPDVTQYVSSITCPDPSHRRPF